MPTPQTGLRFFTVYGPWGRPDMAVYSFAKAILFGTPIRVFEGGRLRRDFTYIDDIVASVLAALDRVPDGPSDVVPHRTYNLGNHRPETVNRLIAELEQAIGRKAIIEYAPMQPGDVTATCADIDDSRRDPGVHPATPLEDRIERFVTWPRGYHAADAG